MDGVVHEYSTVLVSKYRGEKNWTSKRILNNGLYPTHSSSLSAEYNKPLCLTLTEYEKLIDSLKTAEVRQTIRKQGLDGP